ncbi:MAG: nuclease [Cypionkella sp.]|uniref:excalibur calcium-binding domain-containing protein n=1 Tax=Cypionkella sp. TaxID=2811411 RepID=UPI002A3DC28E|nr:nuclease [Cypionkella sp.]
MGPEEERAATIAMLLAGLGTNVMLQPNLVTLRLPAKKLRRRLLVQASLSCNPRKNMSKTVGSCEKAHWLMENCSWGSKLDGDGDGMPCENICSGG